MSHLILIYTVCPLVFEFSILCCMEKTFFEKFVVFFFWCFKRFFFGKSLEIGCSSKIDCSKSGLNYISYVFFLILPVVDCPVYL